MWDFFGMEEVVVFTFQINKDLKVIASHIEDTMGPSVLYDYWLIIRRKVVSHYPGEKTTARIP